MSLQWQEEKRGLFAEECGCTLWVRRSQTGDWLWSVEAQTRAHDVRGRAADLEQAKVYAEACFRVAVVMAQRAEVERMREHVARLSRCVQGVFPSVSGLEGWDAWCKDATDALLYAQKGGR